MQVFLFFSCTQVKPYDYEHSEFLLYHNQVVRESGDSEKALQHLEKYEVQICDQVSIMETRGKTCKMPVKPLQSSEIPCRTLTHLMLNDLPWSWG